VCDMTADDIGEEDSPSERQQELLLYSSADETESSFRKHRHRRSWTWTQRGTQGGGARLARLSTVRRISYAPCVPVHVP